MRPGDATTRREERRGAGERAATEEEEEEEFPLIARVKAMRARRMQQQKEQRERQHEKRSDARGVGERTGRRRVGTAGGSPDGELRMVDGRPHRRVQCRVVVPGTMASPEPPRDSARPQGVLRPRKALKERGLNRMGSKSPGGNRRVVSQRSKGAPGGGIERIPTVPATPKLSSSSALHSPAPPSSSDAPTLVKAEFNDVCVRMARIGREVNDLILRGCYLSQQTMMDAEANHRSAFRVAAETLVDARVEATADGKKMEIGTMEKEEDEHPPTGLALVSPTYRLASHPGHRPHPQQFHPENSLGLIARGFSLSRLREEEESESEAAPANTNQCYPQSQTIFEKASRRGLETVKRIFLAWRRRTWVRICVTQRLGRGEGRGKEGAGGGGGGGDGKGAHARLGNRRPFDAAAVFARDGKHRMAREWREHRMKRVCIAKLMVHLVLADGSGEEKEGDNNEDQEEIAPLSSD